MLGSIPLRNFDRSGDIGSFRSIVGEAPEAGIEPASKSLNQLEFQLVMSLPIGVRVECGELVVARTFGASVIVLWTSRAIQTKRLDRNFKRDILIYVP
jgi:hypothetical protein